MFSLFSKNQENRYYHVNFTLEQKINIKKKHKTTLSNLSNFLKQLIVYLIFAIVTKPPMRMQCAVVELEMPNYQSALDVSHHQGKINWKKVKNTGIEHVIMKATEGSYYQDVTFLYNWEMAKLHNIRTSVYHYFRALINPEEQVANVINTLSLTTFNYTKDILAIDVEEKGNELASPDQVAHTLYRLLKGLESNDFIKIYIYCSPYYWENQVNWRMYDFSKYPLWIAWYNGEIKSQPKIPSTWKNVGWTCWQYSNLGKVDGIDTYVDLDFCKTHTI